VLIDENGLPKGTEIKGAVAREIAERYPKVVAIAQAVV
jgi:large subunit ribosomal protein L14